jgi:DnaK suppressor protein
MAKNKEIKKRPIRHKSAGKTNPKKRIAPVYTKTSEYLTDQEVEHYKKLLLDKMQELIGDVNSIEDGALKKSRLDASGDLSSMPIHMADLGTDNYDQEFALNLLDSERKILNEIIEALKR